MQPPHINPYQPHRQGEYHRTYPDLTRKRIYETTHLHHRVAQIHLYRWSRSFDFQKIVGISDLHRFLFEHLNGPFVSLPFMGATVVGALSIDVRKMKWVEGVALWTYRFPDSTCLSYGLEFMICSWLRKFVTSDTDNLEFWLNDIANCTEPEFISGYHDQMSKHSFKEPNWIELTKSLPNIDVIETSGSRYVKRDRPPLRDLSQYGRRGR